MSSSDLDYRDYSLEILQRPLPAIEAPETEHIFTTQQHIAASTSGQPQPPPPSPLPPPPSPLLLPPPSPPVSIRMSDTARKEQWKTNVNSAISGNDATLDQVNLGIHL